MSWVCHLAPTWLFSLVSVTPQSWDKLLLTELSVPQRHQLCPWDLLTRQSRAHLLGLQSRNSMPALTGGPEDVPGGRPSLLWADLSLPGCNRWVEKAESGSARAQGTPHCLAAHADALLPGLGRQFPRCSAGCRKSYRSSQSLLCLRTGRSEKTTAACRRLELKGPTSPRQASLRGCIPEAREPLQSLLLTVRQQALHPQGLALSEQKTPANFVFYAVFTGSHCWCNLSPSPIPQPSSVLYFPSPW